MGKEDDEMRILLEDMAQELSKLYKDGSSLRIRTKRSPELARAEEALARAVESTAVMTNAPAGVVSALRKMNAAVKSVSKALRSRRVVVTSDNDGSETKEKRSGEAKGSSGGVKAAEEWALLESKTNVLYENLAGLMRASGLHVPQVRNFKLTRSLYHVTNALAMVGLAELCWSTQDLFIISTACFSAAWIMEVLKQKSDLVKRTMFRMLGFLTRDGEQHTINSATWYMSGMFILALSFKENKLPCCLGSLALGVGDPAAALIGSKFGQIKIFGKKTLEGTSAFFVVNFLFNLLYLSLFYQLGSLQDSLALAAVGAVTGAVVELYCPTDLGLDDNLVVPVATAYIVWAFVEVTQLATPYVDGGVAPVPWLGISGSLPPEGPGIFSGLAPGIYTLPIWTAILPASATP